MYVHIYIYYIIFIFVGELLLLETCLAKNSPRFSPPPPPTLMKHKIFSARGHQWPFYHLKIRKKSFPMVTESALGYLIPDLIQISSTSLILSNLSVILRRYKILH